MKHLIRLFVSLVVPAFILAGVASSPAMAQDKAKAAPAAKAEKGKAKVKVLFDNDKVRVQEVTFKPGDVGGNVARPFRVIRPLKGGTFERNYADGRKETVENKTGEVRVAGPDKEAYWLKNIGKTTIVNFVVVIKQAKK